MLRCFCLANAPVASGAAEFCLGMVDEWGTWARLRCVICEDTGGAVFRPGVLKVISVLKNGGIRQRSDRHGAGGFLLYEV